MNNIEELKISIKQNIKLLIEKNMFYEANTLLEQLKKIAPNDTELYAMQAAIALAENHLEEAEELLQTGLQYNAKNPNLLFHFACLMEKKHEWEEAKFYCQNASECTNNLQLKKEIAHLLSRINEHIKEPNNKIKSFNPKISVIIPTYNLKNYLKETIDSILQQDYGNLEIIVGDDCSTDGTKEMIQQYYNNPKIKYIRNEVNLGVRLNAYKLLHEYADGKYVLCINHDDYLTQNDYISKAITLLEENPNVSLAFANVEIIYQGSHQKQCTTINIPSITNGTDYFLNYETQRYPHITSFLTSVFRKDKAIHMGCFTEETQSQDMFLYLKMMLAGNIGFIKDCVGTYRVHEKGLTYNMNMKFDSTTIDELEKLHTAALERGLDPSQLEKWITKRIYVYIQWRISNIWNQNRKAALQLLLNIEERYPIVFEHITNQIQWR
ncbi:glycosyltransferase [Bacillus fungorum]|uniref:glycosyltransferase n=1 Tax=Bacillus fungorum TaxID=2039284 RepID=UPI0033988BD6